MPFHKILSCQEPASTVNKEAEVSTSDTELLCCPICFEPLIRKGPAGLNQYVTRVALSSIFVLVVSVILLSEGRIVFGSSNVVRILSGNLGPGVFLLGLRLGCSGLFFTHEL